MEWTKKEAQEKAVAAGDADWEKGLKQMLRVTESCAINLKLGVITKGRFSRAMDMIEVPTHDWFHSAQSSIIYHYNAGNFVMSQHLNC